MIPYSKKQFDDATFTVYCLATLTSTLWSYQPDRQTDRQRGGHTATSFLIWLLKCTITYKHCSSWCHENSLYRAILPTLIRYFFVFESTIPQLHIAKVYTAGFQHFLKDWLLSGVHWRFCFAAAVPLGLVWIWLLHILDWYKCKIGFIFNILVGLNNQTSKLADLQHEMLVSFRTAYFFFGGNARMV